VKDFNAPVAGEYRIRVKLSGLKPAGGRAPRLTVYAADVDRLLGEQDVVAPEDKPTVVEFTAHLSAGHHMIRISNEAPGPATTSTAAAATAAGRSSASRTAASRGSGR
jgi:hypothetical protein